MSRLLKDWGFALLLGATVFLIISWWQGHGPDMAGQAPTFAARDLDGNKVDLASLRGKAVVLNFWATWCGPCRAEIPSFVKFAKKNPDVVMLGMATASGGEDEVGPVARRMGISYPVIITPQEVVDAYQIDVFPTTFVIGPDGAVVASRAGMMDEADLETAVRGALAAADGVPK